MVLLQEEVVHQQVAGRQDEAHEQQEVPQQEVPQQTKVTCSLCQALVSKKSIRAHEKTQKCKAARPAPSPSLKRETKGHPSTPPRH